MFHNDSPRRPFPPALWLLRLWVVFLLGTAPAFAAPFAVLSDVKGEVQIVHGKKTQSGKSGSSLFAGDLVRVVSGNATIYYATRAPQTLQGGAQATIGGTESALPAAPMAPWKNVYAGLSSGFSRRSQTKAFAVRGNEGPCPLVPASLIATSHPTFVWVAPRDAENLKVQAYDIALFGPRDALVWRASTNKTVIVYPDDAPPLQAGTRYAWQVTPRRLTMGKDSAPQLRLDDNYKSLGLWFETAKTGEDAQAQTEVARLQTELGDATPTARNLAIAALLRERGLATAAITVLLPAIFNPTPPPQTPGEASYTLTWPVFRAAHANLDDATQVFINELAAQMDIDTG